MFRKSVLLYFEQAESSNEAWTHKLDRNSACSACKYKCGFFNTSQIPMAASTSPSAHIQGLVSEARERCTLDEIKDETEHQRSRISTAEDDIEVGQIIICRLILSSCASSIHFLYTLILLAETQTSVPEVGDNITKHYATPLYYMKKHNNIFSW